MDDRSHIKVHTDERTQVYSAQSSLAVTHSSIDRVRRYLTAVTESPSKHWSPPRTSPYKMSDVILEATYNELCNLFMHTFSF